MMKFKGFFKGISIDTSYGRMNCYDASITFRTCGLSVDQINTLKNLVVANQEMPTLYDITIEREHRTFIVKSPLDALLKVLEGYEFNIPEVTRHIVCNAESYVVVLPPHVTDDTIMKVKRDILGVLPEDLGVFVTRKVTYKE
jgi:hypothetical protein